jgi:hypothetical protein
LILSGQSQSPTATIDGGWDFDGRVPPRYTIAGELDFPSGHLTASLWQVEDTVGSSIDVVVESYNALQGQLADPALGASGNFTGGPCTFQVTGHR